MTMQAMSQVLCLQSALLEALMTSKAEPSVAAAGAVSSQCHHLAVMLAQQQQCLKLAKHL